MRCSSLRPRGAQYVIVPGRLSVLVAEPRRHREVLSAMISTTALDVAKLTLCDARLSAADGAPGPSPIRAKKYRGASTRGVLRAIFGDAVLLPMPGRSGGAARAPETHVAPMAAVLRMHLTFDVGGFCAGCRAHHALGATVLCAEQYTGSI